MRIDFSVSIIINSIKDNKQTVIVVEEPLDFDHSHRSMGFM